VCGTSIGQSDDNSLCRRCERLYARFKQHGIFGETVDQAIVQRVSMNGNGRAIGIGDATRGLRECIPALIKYEHLFKGGSSVDQMFDRKYARKTGKGVCSEGNAGTHWRNLRSPFDDQKLNSTHVKLARKCESGDARTLDQNFHHALP